MHGIFCYALPNLAPVNMAGTSSVSQVEKHQEYLLYRVAMNNCMESKGKDLENTPGFKEIWETTGSQSGS